MSGGDFGQCTEGFYNKFYHDVDRTRQCEKNGRATGYVVLVGDHIGSIREVCDMHNKMN